MLWGSGALGLISLLLLVWSALDLATTRPADVRTLPKPLWFVVLLLPLVGPLAWYLAGRPAHGRRTPRAQPARPPVPPDDDEAFLRELRRRAEEQRRRADEQQRRRDEDGRSA